MVVRGQVAEREREREDDALMTSLHLLMGTPLRLRRAGRDKPNRRNRVLTRSHATNVSDTLSDTLLLERRIEDTPEKIALALR